MFDSIMESVYDDMPDPVKYQRQRNEQADAEIEFQRLCYEIFMINPDGKRLYELLKERFLIQAAIPAHKIDVNLAVYLEGMREVVRGLAMQARLYKARIQQIQEVTE